MAVRNPRLWDAVNIGAFPLALIVYMFGAVSVLRSKSTSRWRGVAKFLTVLGLIGTVAISIAMLFPDRSELETQLRDAARGIAMARGQKIDEITSIKGASYQGGTFSYEYYITEDAGLSLEGNSQSQFALSTNLKLKACDNIIKGSEDILKLVEYRYYTPDDVLRFTVPVQAAECIAKE